MIIDNPIIEEIKTGMSESILNFVLTLIIIRMIKIPKIEEMDDNSPKFE